MIILFYLSDVATFLNALTRKRLNHFLRSIVTESDLDRVWNSVINGIKVMSEEDSDE